MAESKKKIIAFLMLSYLLFTPLQINSEIQENSDAYKAIRDARLHVEQLEVSPLWFAIGFFGGCIGFSLSFLSEPQIPTQNLIGKSSEYVNFYILEYKSRIKNRNRILAGVGCGLSAFVLYTFNRINLQGYLDN